MKKIVKNKFFLILVALIALMFFAAKFMDSNANFTRTIRDNIPYQLKDFLKKTIFIIPAQNKTNLELKRSITNLTKKIQKQELELSGIKNKLTCCEKISEANIISKNKINYKLSKFSLPFYDLSNPYNNKKSGYIEIYKSKIFIIFWSGKVITIEKESLNNNILLFEKINTNLNEKYIEDKIKNIAMDDGLIWTGIRDIKINKDKLFVSVVKKVNSNCYNTSVVFSEINYQYLNFKDFFTYKECVDIDKSAKINNRKFFAGWQNGGRIEFLDKDNMILTVGDYGDWSLPQNDKSMFGKIININNKNFRLISKGHRNPQGLYVDTDDKNKFILSTEHGPYGGDEVNLIKNDKNKIFNYGWPISSYGEHYRSSTKNYKINKLAPLHKSHKKYGFEEPIKNYKNAIGISQIIKNNFSYNKYDYFITSLKNKTIYNLKFDKKFQDTNYEDEIKINERIRDIIYDEENKHYYMLLENTGSIGIFKKLN